MQWFMKALPLPLPHHNEPVDFIHGVEFAVSKHKADLFYYQREYRKASELYKQLLAAVPTSNACVTKELRDGLARSYLKLGEGELAKQEAEKLVRKRVFRIVPRFCSLCVGVVPS